MKFETIYNDFYNKYYTKSELLIKNYFVKRKNENRNFGKSINEVNRFLTEDVNPKIKFSSYTELLELHQKFIKRHYEYDVDEIRLVLVNDIEPMYKKIPFSELPTDYNFIKFVKEIALMDIKIELLRLLSVNSALLQLFHEANDFSEFEIRNLGNISVYDSPIYKRFFAKAHPKNSLENAEIEIQMEKIEISEVPESIENFENNDDIFFRQLILDVNGLEIEKLILERYSKIKPREARYLLEHFQSLNLLGKTHGIGKDFVKSLNNSYNGKHFLNYTSIVGYELDLVNNKNYKNFKLQLNNLLSDYI